ncbi:cell division protein PerM [Timonella sp. A28]|uniref:cell division protein PerM n=1 Tax=Timonella sp. A28 TaxID=3442640 RepID=UPI003EBCECF4
MGNAGYEPANRKASKRTQNIIEDRQTLRKQLSVDDSIEGGSTALSGLLTAIQTLIFGMAIIVIPVLVTAVISTTLVDQDFSFGAALKAGLAFWAVAHGSYATVDGTTLTMAPLGLTLLVVAAGVLSVRRSLRVSSAALIVYSASYTLLIAAASLIATPHLVGLTRTIVSTLIIVWLSLYIGLRKREDGHAFYGIHKQLSGRKEWIETSLRGGIITLLTLTILGALASIAWFVLGRDAMSQVLGDWPLDALSGIALGVAQISLVPNLIVWAASWLSGAGFQIGTGTIISPEHVVLGPLPNLPVLAALPQATAPLAFTITFVVAISLCGFFGAQTIVRCTETLRWWNIVAAPLILTATTVFMWTVLVWLASGAIGPGNLTEFGPELWTSALRIAVLVGIGAGIRVLVGRKEIRQGLSSTKKTTSYSPSTASSARSTRTNSSTASGTSARSVPSSRSTPSGNSSRTAHSAQEPTE